MKVGIIGLGCVGGAAKYGFEKLGHEVKVHDIAMDTSLSDVLDTRIVYVCVPTPMAENGECDVSIVEQVVDDLVKADYSGTIAIKSTVVPGTTKRLFEKYSYLTEIKICFVPEFLRERCATTDFVENHDLLVIGHEDYEYSGHYDMGDYVFYDVKECHGKLPKKVVRMSSTEAELVKYFNNVYNATLITFANSFYEICKGLGVDYTNVKDAVVNRKHINDIYLDCNDNFRGFGGMCLPKDMNALNSLAVRLGIDVKFFKNILEENAKYKVTVYDGMRK